jgi:hypothetical protein
MTSRHSVHWPIQFPLPIFDNAKSKLVASKALNEAKHASETVQFSKGKESRTALTLSSVIHGNATQLLVSTNIERNSEGYWRFTALCLEYSWTSSMTEKQWTVAANIYNNSETYISSANFSAKHGCPKDPLKRNGATLQKACFKFEEDVKRWMAEKELGKKRM